MKAKTFPFLLLLLLIFIILWIRLFYLQIIKGANNKVLADNNRIKIIKIPALRGVLYDRNNQVLARNRPEGREYVNGSALAHVLGYLAQASRQDIENNDQYQAGNLIGKMGIEQHYDQVLRGIDGGLLVEEDALGQVIRQVAQKQPIAGDSLNLTLDSLLQQKAFTSLKQRKGAVVASNPKTGEILVLLSSPSFDPNVFTLTKDNQEKIKSVFASPDQPMFNRAIAGLYPPASTFKIITAIAGLEEQSINSSTLVEDTGEIRIGQFVFGNWYFNQYGKTEGMVDIIKAIKRSNDIFFYKTGEWLGITKLSNWAKYFGLGSVLGIDISGEAEGLIPSPEWKKQQKLESWYLGDTYITAIGQGDLQLTPLQVNHLTSIIASDGKSCTPYLIKKDSSDQLCQELDISKSNILLVKEGMKQACQEGGTGWPFFNFTPLVGCKTGTAEYGDPQDKTHAWFTVFAPWDDPEIVVTVLLEGAGEGSYEAAPVAKEILASWFSSK